MVFIDDHQAQEQQLSSKLAFQLNLLTGFKCCISKHFGANICFYFQPSRCEDGVLSFCEALAAILSPKSATTTPKAKARVVGWLEFNQGDQQRSRILLGKLGPFGRDQVTFYRS